MSLSRIFEKKSIKAIQGDSKKGELKRTLSALNLVSLGIGCIIGTGIFVMTGQAAALYAGPAIVLSFVLAGICCGFAALCYAELASMLPVSGSAYSYSYASLGEVFDESVANGFEQQAAYQTNATGAVTDALTAWIPRYAVGACPPRNRRPQKIRDSARFQSRRAAKMPARS